MTSFTPTNAPVYRSLIRRGFTLVEIMVVIGIIILIMAFAIPAGNRAYRSAVKAKMKADLLVLSQAMDAYRADHRDYPRNVYQDQSGVQGAETLCWAILGVGNAQTDLNHDGADGLGFRLRGPTGQVYGPYVAAGRFKVGVDTNSSAKATIQSIQDKYGHSILYFPGNSAAQVSGTTGAAAYVSNYTTASGNPKPMFNQADNTLLPLEAMQKALGDANANGVIDPGETAVYTGPYILWAAGPAEDYVDAAKNGRDRVTSFDP